MRAWSTRLASSVELRRKVERLQGLPLRPATARAIFGVIPEDPLAPAADFNDSPRGPAILDADPGWVLVRTTRGTAPDPLDLIAESPWWSSFSGLDLESITRLWRHAVAVGQAARRLAREAGDPDPERIARAGFLHGLGRWAAAVAEPAWLTSWFAEPDHRKRRALEVKTLGVEAATLGRTLAERWGCDPLVADAIWLHAELESGLSSVASDPARLGLIQQAYQWAERTPWSLFGAAPKEAGGNDPRLRLLIAEVQTRSGGAFIEPDATLHEERMSRSNARLRRQFVEMAEREAAQNQLLATMADSDPLELPEIWAERAALAWCGVPGVATARVEWIGPGAALPEGESPANQDRPPSRTLKLKNRRRPLAEISLWAESDAATLPRETDSLTRAWTAWASLLAERVKADQRLDAVTSAHHERVETDEPRVRLAKLDALAEFAAGAGHELNNPLAVIVGRAQLLLARETEPGAVRSLRAILGQAQRAHRILRDLMFVARPQGPRLRSCQVEEIVRASLRDFKAEAEARGIRLKAEGIEATTKAWADADALRHIADVLIRNALESTAKGGTIVFSSAGNEQGLQWTVQDNGRGMTAVEGQHLFDPFFCGRQAGRGLGLGLPRAARIISLAGGELRWHSAPGQGATFHVHLPLSAPPKPPTTTSDLPPEASRDDLRVHNS